MTSLWPMAIILGVGLVLCVLMVLDLVVFA